MGNPEHIEMIKQGIDTWNQWRQENRNIIPDLQFADLSERDLGAHDPAMRPINLDNADLRGANLSGADLEYAYIRKANLSGAIIRKANLRVIRLSGANLSNADLSYSVLNSEVEGDLSGITGLVGANLTSANLSFARLRDVDLERANFTRTTFFRTHLRLSSFEGAIFDETVIIDSDLGGAHGFEKCIHNGPSYIDRSSIEKSGGLPLNFLRGLGVDEIHMENESTLIGDNSLYHSAFISYSSRDSIIATRLHTYLQANGVRCWYAPEDLKIGAKIRSALDFEIDRHDKLLLILSNKSIGSQWVEQEVEKALEKERLLRQKLHRDELVLFPIRIDSAVFETNAGWASLLKNTRNIGDFTGWQDAGRFEQSLARLLKDLEKPRNT